MKNKKVLHILVIMVLLAIVAIRIYKYYQQVSDDNVLRIGAVLPLTGNLAFFGEACKEGIILATETFSRENPHHKLAVFFEDSKGTVKDSIAAYNNLKSKTPISMLICISSVSAKAIVNQDIKELTLLTLVSDPTITLGNTNVFNMNIDLRQELQAMCNLWVSKKIKNISLIYPKDELGNDAREIILDLAKKYSLTVANEEEVSSSDNINAAVANIISSQSDAVFVSTLGGGAALAVKRLRELKYHGDICVSMAFNSPNIIQQAGDAANGIYICYAPFNLDEENSYLAFKKFRDLYTERFTKGPDYLSAAYAFCITDIALRTYTTSGYDIDKTKEMLANLKDAPSIFGGITCSDRRTFYFPIDVGVLDNGTIVKMHSAHESN
jgi:branched-chain amino acid transport system substrate-binding protein